MRRNALPLILLMTVFIVVFFMLNLLLGTVQIPFSSVVNILFGGDGEPETWSRWQVLLY